MSGFERIELAQDKDGKGDEQEHRKSSNPFGGLIDGAKGLLNRGKRAVQDIDTDEIGQDLGRIGNQVGEQAKRIGGGLQERAEDYAQSGQRVINGEGTPEDRRKLIELGKDAAGLAAGGVPLGMVGDLLGRKGGGNGLVDDLLGRRSGGGMGDIETFLKQAVREVVPPRFDTLDFAKAGMENFALLDGDKNGFISREEVDTAKENQDLLKNNSQLVDVLDKDFDTLRKMSNDEWFSESKGIAKDDFVALRRARLEGTGFGVFGNAASGAWDSKYLSAAAGLGAGATSYGKVGIGKMGGRAAIATGAVLTAGAIYGSIDYATSRKENLETMISKLH